jgi:hypothetical protein
MKKYILILLTVILFSSCEKPLEYKYQDRNPILVCTGIDSKLANEAYYSFREDLAEYAIKTVNQLDYIDYQYSLALYIFSGASGTADYKAIASKHSLAILEKLKNEGQIWENPETGELNYHSELISCLIESIQDENLSHALLSLREINTINTYSMAEDYRISISNAETDKAYAMFLAFDSYYKHLAKINK